MAGQLNVDTLKADSNLRLQIASANVAFIDVNGLTIVGNSLNVGGGRIVVTSNNSISTPSVIGANLVTVSGTTALGITANGQITTANAPFILTGGQLQFPATQIASGDANCLDDYEEGTYSPVITGSSSNPTITYSVQNGFYCKIGRTVIAQGRVATSAWSSGTGDLRVSLPFASNSTSGYRAAGSCSYISNITNGGSAFVPQVGENVSYMIFYKYTDSDQLDTEVPVNSNTSGTTQINFTVVYQV